MQDVSQVERLSLLPHGALPHITVLYFSVHPFHLHGHHFQVVHKSQDVTSDDASLNPPLVEGQANPMRRDTVMVPPGGSASIRFRADNPGAWLMHCRELISLRSARHLSQTGFILLQTLNGILNLGSGW